MQENLHDPMSTTATSDKNLFESTRASVNILIASLIAFEIDVTPEDLPPLTENVSIDYIRSLLALPIIVAAWENEYSHSPTSEDAESLYELYMIMEQSVVSGL